MKTNKTKLVLQYLLEKGEITSWEAIEMFGATRLSAIIFRLRNDYHLNIETHNIVFKDRYGNEGTYALYKLVNDNESVL